ALAVGRIGDREALPALAKLLSDSAAGATVAWALGRIDGGEAALLACLASSCPAAAPCARALGTGTRSPAALDGLARALGSTDPSVAGAAATSLGVLARIGPTGTDQQVATRARPSLGRLLGSREAAVRRGAAYALGRIPPDPAPEMLAALLSDPEGEVRALAARAFGKQRGDPRRLDPSLRDPDVRVRVEAARALGADAEARSIVAAAIVPAINDLR